MLEIVGGEDMVTSLQSLAMFTPVDIINLPASIIVSELDRIDANLPNSIEEDVIQWKEQAEKGKYTKNTAS